MKEEQYGQNERFFRGRRQSPWLMVAYGMVGASISGVTFVGVPGMVLSQQMTYLQTCLGFILGYVVVALLLLPLYYRSGSASIYSLLQQRLGLSARKVGAAIFLVGKLASASVRFYIACLIVHGLLLRPLDVPFAVTATLMALAVWLYTRSGGIATLVRTDVVQTTCMLLALLLIMFKVMSELHFSPVEAVQAVAGSDMSRIFVWDDWQSPRWFWKQFLSGIFIVVVMTGLDQDMMQKNLTCRSLRKAQANMCCYGLAFVPVNLLFLSLGALLVLLAGQWGMSLPARGDELLPMFAATGRLGMTVVVLFVVGVVSASLSSADSALTALTTSACVDLWQRPDDPAFRRRVHFLITVVFVLLVVGVDAWGSRSVIDTIYTLVGYTYGPLLGLFAYALLNRSRLNGTSLALVCLASPLLCGIMSWTAARCQGYQFGYELLLLNGFLTWVGLCLTRNVSKGATRQAN